MNITIGAASFSTKNGIDSLGPTNKNNEHLMYYKGSKEPFIGFFGARLKTITPLGTEDAAWDKIVRTAQ